jgi:hypothetical protein
VWSRRRKGVFCETKSPLRAKNAQITERTRRGAFSLFGVLSPFVIEPPAMGDHWARLSPTESQDDGCRTTQVIELASVKWLTFAEPNGHLAPEKAEAPERKRVIVSARAVDAISLSSTAPADHFRLTLMP